MTIVHACEKREIVGRLQQPEMVANRHISRLLGSEPPVGSNLLTQASLQHLLLSKKIVKQRKRRRLDCRSVDALAEQIVGMHGDEDCRVRVLFRHQSYRPIAHREIISEIYLLKRGIFPD